MAREDYLQDQLEVKMLKETMKKVYHKTPKSYQPSVVKWFYVLNPKLSWDDFSRRELATRDFAERFFGTEERMKAYEAEFKESIVGPAVYDGIQQLPEDVSLYDAHKDECIRMYALIREYKPETIVETGVYSGVSTLSILAALAANGSGRLYSVDYSQELTNCPNLDPITKASYFRGRPSCAEEGTHVVPAGKDPGWIIPDELRTRWEFIPGKPQTELPPLLSQLGKIDFFHHDSSHSVSSMMFEFELAWEYLRPGGIMVSNHIGWNDAFETFVAEHSQDYGLMTWHYNPYLDYTRPGSSGYIVKSVTGSPPGEHNDVATGQAQPVVPTDSEASAQLASD